MNTYSHKSNARRAARAEAKAKAKEIGAMTNTKIAFSLFFAGLVLANCMRFESVSLRHPVTGEVVRCGPYTVLHYIPHVTVADIIYNCVADYQDQGYEREPAP